MFNSVICLFKSHFLGYAFYSVSSCAPSNLYLSPRLGTTDLLFMAVDWLYLPRLLYKWKRAVGLCCSVVTVCVR